MMECFEVLLEQKYDKKIIQNIIILNNKILKNWLTKLKMMKMIKSKVQYF